MVLRQAWIEHFLLINLLGSCLEHAWNLHSNAGRKQDRSRLKRDDYGEGDLGKRLQGD